MEEKRYPELDTETRVGMAGGEPVVEAMVAPSPSVDGATSVHDWIDDIDWDRFPSFGPFSEEEAIARIEEAERDKKNPSKWISAQELDRQLYAKFPWLR